MPLSNLPTELLFLIADCLRPSDVFSLIRANRHFAQILTSLLHELALHVGEKEQITALQWAASRRLESLVTLLLKEGVDVHEVKGPETPLLRAVGNGDEKIVKLLLNNEAGVGMGFEVLETAAIWGSEAMVRLLLENGAHHSMRGRRRNFTALHVAVMHRNEGAVRALLEKGARVNFPIEEVGLSINQVHSPLIEAVSFNPPSLTIINLLLEAGADATQFSNSGYPLIHIAVLSHSVTEVIELLVAYGAKISDVVGGRNTALHCAATRAAVSQPHAAVVKCLLENGADITVRDDRGYTAIEDLMVAYIVHGDPEFDIKPVVDMLLDLSTDSCRLDSLLQVLDWAAEHGHEDILNRLLENGVDPSTRNWINGWTALHSAAANGQKAVVEQLLRRGVHISIRESSGDSTLLHIAAQYRQPEMVKFLLERGIEVNATNKLGQTALDLVSLPRQTIRRSTDVMSGSPAPLISETELEDELSETLSQHGAEHGFDIGVLLPGCCLEWTRM